MSETTQGPDLLVLIKEATTHFQRAQQTLSERTAKEQDTELIDVHDDVCNGLDVLATATPNEDAVRDNPADDDFDSFDMTPVGCSTPEGCKRVNQATSEFSDATAAVANQFEQLLEQLLPDHDRYGLWHLLILTGVEKEEAHELANEIFGTIERRRKAQEELLRSIAGAPPQVT